MSKDWNDEVAEYDEGKLRAVVNEQHKLIVQLLTKDNLTSSQDVGGNRERWDIQWEVERLANQVKFMEKDIESLRFELAKEQYAKAMLIAELNAIKGKGKAE